MESRAQTLAIAFTGQAAAHIQHDFLPKIRRCLEILSEDEVWHRGSEFENSIGNLLLHLGGNVRQWIISGLGGVPDQRDRGNEFAARSSMPKGEAFALLENTAAEAVSVLEHLGSEDLMRERTIQGFRQTGLQAVFHVVEHFSYHTGQIVFATKMLKQVDLEFYDL